MENKEFGVRFLQGEHIVNKPTLTSWAAALQEGIDYVKSANTMRECDAQKKFFNLGMDSLKELRDEILQAMHYMTK